jgi:sorbitol/mannitol transport system permease protein
MTADTDSRTVGADYAGVRPRRRRRSLEKGNPLWGLLAWVVGLLAFFPVFWMAITGFRQEADASTTPPKLFSAPTLTQYREIFDRDLAPYLINSMISSVFSVLLVIVLAVPAAYALSLRPVAKWRDVLFFFISTKMLPLVAAIVPIYLTVKTLGMLDNIWTLVVLYTAMNLPLAIWVMRSFFLEVPVELLEASALDGASLRVQLQKVVAPIVSPGVAATALICFIFSWNEFLFALNLTSTTAGTAPVFLIGFVSGEGLFLAKLCAAATLVSLPVLLAGWVAQNKLVRGLSMGAIK